MANSPGQDKEYALRRAGFGDEEINAWKAETVKSLAVAGFNDKDVHDYFGVQEPNMDGVKSAVAENIAAASSPESTAQFKLPTKQPGEAHTFLEALEAGFQMSVTGLVSRGKAPDLTVPENESMFYKIASQAGTIVGDLPAMVVGGALGGAGGKVVGGTAGAVVGSAVPGVGTITGVAVGSTGGQAVGQGAGAMALPAVIRSMLMQHYEKGDIKDFKDFWERSSAAFIDATKQGVVGGATMGVGGLVSKALAPVAAPSVAAISTAAAEVGTMVTVGAAMEGHAPHSEDFLEAALLVGALHGAGRAASKMREMYAKTGIRPEEVARQAQRDPILKQELLTEEAVPKTPEQMVLSKIGEKGTKEVPKPLKERMTDAKNEAYRNVVDKFDPILRADKEAYVATRLTAGSAAKAEVFIEKGAFSFKDPKVKTGKGLLEIIKPFEKDENFVAYVTAKRAVEVEASGRKSGFDLESAKKTTSNPENVAKYEQASKDLTEYNNNLIRYLGESGLKSAKEVQTLIDEGAAYVPLKRIVEGEAVGGGSSSPVKELKGVKSEETLTQNPIQSTLERTFAVVQLAEKNRAKLTLVDNVSKGKEPLLQKVSGKSGEFDFEVFRDGKKETYRPTDSALGEALKALDGDSSAQHFLLDWGSKLTKVKKIGITADPAFILKNWIRDSVTASVFSVSGKTSIIDSLAAMGDIVKKKDVYYDWLKSGGASGTFVEMSSKYLKSDIFNTNKEAGNFVDRSWNVVKTGAEKVAFLSTLIEQSNRVAEFKRVLKMPEKTATDAGFASREVTLDFSRIGAKMQAVNMITAFQNVSIQGLDKTVRAVKENPAGVTGKAALYITAPSVLLWYANKDDKRVQDLPRWQKDLFWIVPTDNWVMAKTPDEAKGLPEHLVKEGKDGKLYVNQGAIYRIPKPQELGVIFGSLPERVLEKFFAENPNAMKGFGDTLSGLVSPSVIPDAILPVLEQATNKSFFSGGKVIPGHLESISPEYQYTPYTSETAKQVGKLVGYVPFIGDIGPKNAPLSSPMVIDNYIQSWTGSIGKTATQILDQALIKSGVVEDPVKPASTLSDIPMIRAFVVRYPSAGLQPIVDFHERYKQSEKVINSIEHLKKTGNVNALEKELLKPENAPMLARLSGINESINTLNRTIQLIHNNKDMTPDDKRQLMDPMYFQMNEMAKAGNEFYRQIDGKGRK